MTPQFQDVQKTWSRIADAFRQPEAVVYMESQAFDKFLRALANNGVLPLYAKLLQEHGVFEKLSPDQKKTIAIAVLRHKAASVVLWCAFDEVMATLRKAGLHPMPIKGTHLGICYYDEPYLRPMVDIDLFFLDLSEAEKGYELFLSNGYLCCEPTRGGDRWLWSRHLPELRKPGARHHIELHGGLIFPPRDRRCQKERVLLEELEEVQYDSYTFKVLKPEAAVIFTLAHTFERHSTDRLA